MSMPPSPVVMVLTASNEKIPTFPNVPSALPLHFPPHDCAVSSRTGIPCLSAISIIFSIFAGAPHIWTGIIAFVLDVILFSRSFGSRQRVSSISANTGVAPVLTATQGGVNLTAVSGNSFPTDGSDWFDSSTGADTTAPVFTADPAVTATSDSGHTFSATLDEDCTLYAVRLASGASAPTAAQIIAGTDAADVALAASEKLSSAYTATVSKNVTFTGGAISTEYDYYFAAQDAAANDSLVKTVTATTTAGTIAIDTDTLTAGAAFTGTYSGIASIASPITIQDSNSNQITVAITDNLDGTFSGTMPALPSSGSASSLLFGSVTVSGNA